MFGLQMITEIVEDPVQKVSVVLLSSPQGGMPIELISPLTEDSPVSNLLKRGVHIYQLCYEVENLERAIEDAKEHKAHVLSEPAPARVFGGRRVAFVYSPDGYIVEFLEKAEPPRDG
jgi:methylmalonyl-CoA/ethylmalonyl-CoA epimerase